MRHPSTLNPNSLRSYIQFSQRQTLTWASHPSNVGRSTNPPHSPTTGPIITKSVSMQGVNKKWMNPKQKCDRQDRRDRPRQVHRMGHLRLIKLFSFLYTRSTEQERQGGAKKKLPHITHTYTHIFGRLFSDRDKKGVKRKNAHAKT